MALHMDGARLWNAVAASGTAPSAFGAEVDALMVCFSEGLGAPIGSMLLGERAFVERARRI